MNSNFQRASTDLWSRQRDYKLCCSPVDLHMTSDFTLHLCYAEYRGTHTACLQFWLVLKVALLL